MKNKSIILSFFIIILSIFTSCSTFVEKPVAVGGIAKLSEVDLFTISRGEAEALIRKNSTGHYSDVFVIIGHSDSPLGYNKTTARDLAILDAKKLLANYMNTSVFSFDNLETIAKAIDKKVKEQYSDDVTLTGKVDTLEPLKQFVISLSNTQLASLLVEKVQYREAVSLSGLPYIEAVVLCTVSDRVINEIQRLITIAFENNENMSKESIEFKNAMKEVAMETVTTMFKEDADDYFNSI